MELPLGVELELHLLAADGPGFPLAASEAAESEGLAVTSQSVRGGANSPQQPTAAPDGAGVLQTGAMPQSSGQGDLLTIDRQTREIRIVIR